MDFSTLGTCVAIVVICYLIGIAVKGIPKVNNELIPVIVGVSGGILGVVGMYVIPDFPATNVMDAIAVGIVSGLASTGANQAWKQLTTKG